MVQAGKPLVGGGEFQGRLTTLTTLSLRWTEWAEKYLHMSDGMFMADEEVEGMNSCRSAQQHLDHLPPPPPPLAELSGAICLLMAVAVVLHVAASRGTETFTVVSLKGYIYMSCTKFQFKHGKFLRFHLL
jgi:hypothetical protein